MTKQILVIGGAGFLGSHLVPALQDRGDVVTVQDIVSPDKAKGLGDAYRWKSLVDVVPEDLQGFDAVMNLAAQADVPLSISSPRWTFHQNLGGVLALLEAVRRTETPVLTMSTENVYGRVPPDRLPAAENLPLLPTNPYAASKVAIEAIAHAYADMYDLDVTVVRSTTMFGERSRQNQVIPIFIRQALAGKPITVEGDGSQSRDFSYVGNTVDGILLAIERTEGWNVWNIGSGHEASILELAKGIIEATHSSSEIVHGPWRAGEPGLRLSVSIEKARKELDYEPRVSTHEGLERTARWTDETYHVRGG